MCTRVLWNDNGLGVYVGRTMDWPESTQPRLVVTPRGHKRDGGLVGTETVVPDNPLRWASSYGSISASVYGIGTVDGINERGLAAHALYLRATELAPRDPSRPGLQIGLWAQYLLDNAATVEEALALTRDVQLVMAEAHGYQATLHLAIEDATGDSAILEHLGGELVVHHGREHRLMTNDPTYDEQLRLLAGQDYSNPSADLPIPGNVNAVDRFQRAAYFTALLPPPRGEREAAASVLSVVRNVSVPFGAPYRDFGIYNTEYRTVCDLTALRYYFELTTTPSLVWTELSRLDLGSGTPARALDPDDIALAGDITDLYAPVDLAY